MFNNFNAYEMVEQTISILQRIHKYILKKKGALQVLAAQQNKLY